MGFHECARVCVCVNKPNICMLKSYLLILQKVTVHGDRIFEEVINLK